MWVAAFELQSTYTDLFTILDFPYGAATDAAALVSWSDRHSFYGVKMLADGLERLHQKPFSALRLLNESALAVEFDAGGGSILEVGVSALDYAQANDAVVRVRNVHDVALGAGLGQLAIDRELDINLTWRHCEQLYRMDVSTKNRTLDMLIVPADEHAANSFVITPGRLAAEVPAADWRSGTLRISSKTLTERAHASLIDGVEVDDIAWKKVVLIARQILVPESTVSRNTGAGVGADED